MSQATDGNSSIPTTANGVDDEEQKLLAKQKKDARDAKKQGKLDKFQQKQAAAAYKPVSEKKDKDKKTTATKEVITYDIPTEEGEMKDTLGAPLKLAGRKDYSTSIDPALVNIRQVGIETSSASIDSAMPAWEIILIVLGSLLVICAIGATAWLIGSRRGRRRGARKREEVTNRNQPTNSAIAGGNAIVQIVDEQPQATGGDGNVANNNDQPGTGERDMYSVIFEYEIPSAGKDDKDGSVWFDMKSFLDTVKTSYENVQYLGKLRTVGFRFLDYKPQVKLAKLEGDYGNDISRVLKVTVVSEKNPLLKQEFMTVIQSDNLPSCYQLHARIMDEIIQIGKAPKTNCNKPAAVGAAATASTSISPAESPSKSIESPSKSELAAAGPSESRKAGGKSTTTKSAIEEATSKIKRPVKSAGGVKLEKN